MAGSHTTKDPDIQLAQAKVMLAQRISGASLEDLAAKFNLSEKTIAKRLKLAKREGLLDDVADIVCEDLLPLAVKVFKQALLDGDIDVARDLMFGTGTLNKNPKPKEDQASMTATAELTLDQYRALLLQESNDTHAQSNAPALLPDPLLPDIVTATPTGAALRTDRREDGLPADEQPAPTPTSED